MFDRFPALEVLDLSQTKFASKRHPSGWWPARIGSKMKVLDLSNIDIGSNTIGPTSSGTVDAHNIMPNLDLRLSPLRRIEISKQWPILSRTNAHLLHNLVALNCFRVAHIKIVRIGYTFCWRSSMARRILSKSTSFENLQPTSKREET